METFTRSKLVFVRLLLWDVVFGAEPWTAVNHRKQRCVKVDYAALATCSLGIGYSKLYSKLIEFTCTSLGRRVVPP